MSGSVSGIRLQEIRGQFVIAGIGSNVGSDRTLYERACRGDHSIGSDGDALIVSVGEVECLSGKVELVPLPEANDASQPQICRGVVRSGEGVTGVARQAVVQVVAVLVGIARDGRVDGASGSVIHDRRESPVVEEAAKKFVPAMERLRFE